MRRQQRTALGKSGSGDFPRGCNDFLPERKVATPFAQVFSFFAGTEAACVEQWAMMAFLDEDKVSAPFIFFWKLFVKSRTKNLLLSLSGICGRRFEGRENAPRAIILIVSFYSCFKTRKSWFLFFLSILMARRCQATFDESKLGFWVTLCPVNALLSISDITFFFISVEIASAISERCLHFISCLIFPFKRLQFCLILDARPLWRKDLNQATEFWFSKSLNQADCLFFLEDLLVGTRK